MTRLSLSNMPATHAHQSSNRYTQPCTYSIWLYTHFLTSQPLTHAHTHTLVSEININSLVREQISRQPFISSACSTLPLHCPLLSIDLCHSLVVLVSVPLSHSFSLLLSVFSFLPVWFLSISHSFSSPSLPACCVPSDSLFRLFLPFHPSVFSLSLIYTHPQA